MYFMKRSSHFNPFTTGNTVSYGHHYAYRNNTEETLLLQDFLVILKHSLQNKNHTELMFSEYYNDCLNNTVIDTTTLLRYITLQYLGIHVATVMFERKTPELLCSD